MSKLKITICDDQDNDHKIVIDNFIKNTFLKGKVEVTSIYFLRKAPKKQKTLLTFIEDTNNEIDFIFLDLHYIPENIHEPLDVIQSVMSLLHKTKRDCTVFLITKDGSDLKNGIHTEGIYTLPMIRKEAGLENTQVFMKSNFDLWLKSKMLSLDFSELRDLRDCILNNEDNYIIKSRKYNLPYLFAHLNNPGEYYSATTHIPSFDFTGWDSLDPKKKMKFELPIRDYYFEIYSNIKHYNEYRKWLEKTKQYLTSIIINANCENLNEEEVTRYNRIFQNAQFRWDTSFLPATLDDEKTISRFIRRVMERNIIIFMYVFAYQSTEEIYYLLEGGKEIPSEKTIGNGFRFTYWLNEFSYDVDIKKREKKFKAIIQQIPYEDKIFLKQTGLAIYNLLTEESCPNLENVLNKKYLDLI